MTAIQLPSSKELGILAGLADTWKANPYADRYLDKHDRVEWDEGYEIGHALLALVKDRDQAKTDA